MDLSRFGAWIVFSLAMVRLLNAQTPQATTSPEPAKDLVLHIDVNLVQVDAVVYDRHDHPVTNLKPEDFEIYEDGKPQPVTAFSYIQLNPGKNIAPPAARQSSVDVPAPQKLDVAQVKRTIVLVADDLNLSWQSTVFLRRALTKFIDTQMGPNDMVSIARTSTGLGALENFTNDKRELHAAADAVRFYLNGRAAVGAFAPTVGGFTRQLDSPGLRAGSETFSGRDENKNDGNSDYLYVLGTMESVASIIDNLRDMPGRKEIILFSDGVPVVPRGDYITEIQHLLRRVADAANRSSVVLNCVDARGLLTLAGSAGDRTQPSYDPLKESRGQDLADQQAGLIFLAAQTGGRAVLNGNDMTWAIDRVLDDLNGYYLIGYQPMPGTFHKEGEPPVFHHIHVRVKQPGLSVRSRTGFFGVTNQESEPKPSNDGEKLLAALRSPFGTNDIPVKLAIQFLSDGNKRSSLSTVLQIDARAIAFGQDADARYHARVELLLTGYDENGRAVEGANNVLDIALPEQQYQSALTDGIVYSQQVPVTRSGAAHIRVAVRDMQSGRVGSTSGFVLLPDLKKNRMVVGTVVMGEKGSSAAGRIFKIGLPIPYRFSILNSRKRGDDVSKIETEVRLFHEGLQVWASAPTVTEAKVEKDSRKLVGDSALHLSETLEPGEYYLQVIARDLLAGRRAAPVTQWASFELKSN